VTFTISYPDPGKFRVAQTVKKQDGIVTVMDGDSPSWDIHLSADRSEARVRRLDGCETGAYALTMDSDGVEVESYSGGMVSFPSRHRVDIPLRPEQYEWAALAVAGAIIGVPLALLCAPDDVPTRIDPRPVPEGPDLGDWLERERRLNPHLPHQPVARPLGTE